MGEVIRLDDVRRNRARPAVSAVAPTEAVFLAWFRLGAAAVEWSLSPWRRR